MEDGNGWMEGLWIQLGIYGKMVSQMTMNSMQTAMQLGQILTILMTVVKIMVILIYQEINY